MQSFRDLRVWRRAHEFVLEVYRISAEFPREEMFGLTSQLRRAATSVPANIAEGAKRVGARDYARFQNIAEGSASETQYLLLLGQELGYVEASRIQAVLAESSEIMKMLAGLRRKVEQAGRGSVSSVDCQLSTVDCSPNKEEPTQC